VATHIPEIKTFKPIRFPDFTRSELDNGIPVYQLVSTEYNVLKLEINFKAGRYFEEIRGVSRACANQMREGTQTHDSEFIADIFDYHGASFQSNGGMDFSRVELYSINRYLENLLPYVSDVLENPLFSEKELNNYQQRNIQRLAIDLAKNDILAYRVLTESLYGDEHPYGYNSTRETIQDLCKNDMVAHYNRCFKGATPGIIVAGGIDDHVLNQLNKTFGQKDFVLPEKPKHAFSTTKNNEQIFIEGQQKFQTSIRVGRRLFSRTNPDYAGIYLLNAVLGGFFGSRLMQNVREEKGLTYDIYSTIDMMWNDGYLMVGAEVDNSNINLVLDEIKSEFKTLQNELIRTDELTLVKNYLKGNLLNLMNGPFNSIELMRLIAVFGYDLEFFNNFMYQLHNIQPDKLQELAKSYLNPEDFTEVIVGTKA